MRLIAELKRRRVFRVAAVYAVVAWLVMQIVAVVTPILELPPSFARGLLVVVLVGFPIAIVLAWAFEVTPEGVRRTVAAPSDAPSRRASPVDYALVVLLVAILGVTVFRSPGRAPGEESSPGTAPTGVDRDTSIAVLPFVNMSDDAANEYFADGVTEEVLNALIRVPGLSVVSRTSVFTFKNSDKPVSQIADELGVAHILEGSVRKAGDRVRITAQLIDADTDRHLWSETYDRELADIFVVQEEIAVAIADEMQISLTSGDLAELVPVRTSDMTAYELYLRAEALTRARGENLRQAIALFREAVARDSLYAPGWAGLSQALMLAPSQIIGLQGPIERAAYWDQSLEAADRALAIDPETAEAISARATVYRFRNQWEDAEKGYLAALEIDPDSPVILEDYSEFLRWTGRFEEALGVAERVVRLDPATSVYRYVLVLSRLSRGQIDRALADLEASTALEPVFRGTYLMISQIHAIEGRFDEARRALRPLSDNAPEFVAAQVAAIDWIESGGAISDEDPSRFQPEFLAIGGEASLAASALFDAPSAYGADLFWRLSLPWYGSLHDDPRYKTTIAELGLPAYWREHGWPDTCRPLGEEDFECE